MDTGAFLRHVLPAAGPYCIAKQIRFADGHSAPVHECAQTIEDAVAIALRFDSEGYDTYFAVGSLVKGQHWEQKLTPRERKPMFEENGEPVMHWRVHRDAANIRGLQAYILDIDVGFKNGKSRGYDTDAEAIAALIDFCKTNRFHKPTVVQSGNGLHVYFVLDAEVPPTIWKRYGENLKELALSAGLKLDTGRTVDPASILRVVGTHNHKYDPAPLVTVLCTGKPTSVEMFHGLLRLRDAASETLGGGPEVTFDTENTGKQRERAVLGFGRLVHICQVFRSAVDPATRDQTSEPIWDGAIRLARLVETPERGRTLCHLVSKDDPRYSEAALNAKLDRYDAMDMGPTTCANFQKREADCTGCPHRDTIVSPAQLAKFMAPTEHLVVEEQQEDGTTVEREIPDPPEPFVRRNGGIAIQTANAKGVPEEKMFCSYDMYPIRLQYDEKTKLEEEVLWNINMPHEGWVTLGIPHTSKNQLATILHKRGIRMRGSDIDIMEWFMTAYVRKLQDETPREMAYAKMGWRKEGGFIVGDVLYKKDGVTEQHVMSHALENATHFGMTVEGDYETWKQGVQIYNRPGMENYRAYLYSTFASPLYCLANQIATCISASGLGGVGKSTLMDMCAAAWGNPRALVVKGNSQGTTRAAAEAMSSAMQHLPIFLDEISDREAKDMTEFIFNYSGGKGKVRSQAAGGVRSDTATWSNFAMFNANSDEYARMSSVHKDSSPHMMRLIQLEFARTDTVSKEEGDITRAIAHENFGHAGRRFAEYIAQHQTNIKQRILRYVIEADKFTKARSEERFWTAWIACLRAAAEICFDLGILEGFPITADVQWMYAQLLRLRVEVEEHTTSSDEVLSEFMDGEIPRTLTISMKNSGNIDNMKEEPRGGLTVRVEDDTRRGYVSRAAFQKYCVDHGINMGRHLKVLFTRGIVLQENMRKVLGAGTLFAKGNVRCIEVDMDKLEGRLHVVKPAPVVAPGIARTGP